jgi:hypothetical protein
LEGIFLEGWQIVFTVYGLALAWAVLSIVAYYLYHKRKEGEST